MLGTQPNETQCIEGRKIRSSFNQHYLDLSLHTYTVRKQAKFTSFSFTSIHFLFYNFMPKSSLLFKRCKNKNYKNFVILVVSCVILPLCEYLKFVVDNFLHFLGCLIISKSSHFCIGFLPV